MNTNHNQVQDMLKNAAQQKPEAQQQQPSQPKQTNRKSRNQTTQNANSTAQELVQSAHAFDADTANMILKNDVVDAMSFAQKRLAVYVSACENTFEAGKKAYFAQSSNRNINQSEELDIKLILKEAGLDVDAMNEELGKQLAQANQQLTLPSTQPLFLLSSAN